MREQDRVRLDRAAGAPGELEVGEGVGVRRAPPRRASTAVTELKCASVLCSSRPPEIWRNSVSAALEAARAARAGAGSSSPDSTSRAPGSKPGATTTSVKIGAIDSAASRVIGAVRGDHAAVGRDRVAGVGERVGLGDRVGRRDAARVRVLDDRDGRAARGRTRRALPHPRRRSCCTTSPCRRAGSPARCRRPARAAVERRALVRVLAVAQQLAARPARADPRREAGRLVVGRENAAHPRGDGDVVARGVPERLERKSAALGERRAAVRERVDDVAVAAPGS